MCLLQEDISDSVREHIVGKHPVRFPPIPPVRAPDAVCQRYERTSKDSILYTFCVRLASEGSVLLICFAIPLLVSCHNMTKNAS